MRPSRLVVELPNGQQIAAGPEAVIGRSAVADIRVDDPRVSTVHAEISWRATGFVVIARGGRVVVNGQPTRETDLTEGSLLTLAPGVDLVVVRIEPGASPLVPSTTGRDWLRLVPGADAVHIHVCEDADPTLVIKGLPGRLLTELLIARDARAWDTLAAALWPDEGALRRRRGPLRDDHWTPIDERRYRNRFDQVLAVLRIQLHRVRAEPTVMLRDGEVSLRLRGEDAIRPSEPAESQR